MNAKTEEIPAKRQKQDRILWIDAAKGICILSVIAGHLGVAEVNSVVYAYHLTVFFLLSGYTLKNNLSKESLCRKFKSLMVPYFTTCALVAVLKCANSVLLYRDASLERISQILYNCLCYGFAASGTATTVLGVELGGRIGAIWFFPALFFGVLFAQLLLRYVPRRAERYLAVAALAVLAVISAKFVYFPFSIQPGMLAVPLILLGYDLRQNGLLERLTLPWFLGCLAVFGIGVCTKLTCIFYVTAQVPDWILSPIFALAASGCVLYLSRKLERCRPLTWLGRHSSYVLCSHLIGLEILWPWLREKLPLLGLAFTPWVNFLFQTAFAVAATSAVLGLKKASAHVRVPVQSSEAQHQQELDIAHSILTVGLLATLYGISGNLNVLLTSLCLPCFAFYGGICYRQETSLGRRSAMLIWARRDLLSYGIYAVLYLLLTMQQPSIEYAAFLLGLRNSSVVTFLLTVFLIRVGYLFLERWLPDCRIRSAAVLLLCLAGKALGEHGWYLPWNLDCAFYGLMLYHLGCCFQQYRILSCIRQRPWFYFLFSCIFAYAVYQGGSDVASRTYGNFATALAGAVSGGVLVYLLGDYLAGALGRWLPRLLSQVGRSAGWIVLVHSLFGAQLDALLALAFTPGYLYHFVLALLFRLALGMLLGWAAEGAERACLHR